MTVSERGLSKETLKHSRIFFWKQGGGWSGTHLIYKGSLDILDGR